MTLLRLLLWARLRSLANGARSERLLLGGKVVATLLVWAAALALGRRLAPPVGAGEPGRLALVALGAWGAFGLLSVPGALRRSFADPEAAILLTQPLPAALRLRVLAGDLWLRNLLQLVPTALLVLLPALAGLPATAGLGWIVLILAGTAVSLGVVLATAFAVLLARGEAAPGRGGPALASFGLAGLGLVALAAAAWIGLGPEGQTAVAGPWAGALLLAGLATLGLGPGARRLGDLYVRAFVAQGASRRSPSGARRRCPALWARLTRPLASPFGAVLYADGLAQGRNPLAWLRLSVIVAAPLAVPAVRRAVAVDLLPREAFGVAFTLVVLMVAVHESLSGAIAGAGDRFLLHASLPDGLAGFLRAKVAVWASGATLLAAVLAAVVGAVLREPADRLLLSACAAALATAGGSFLLLLASAWDLRTHDGLGDGPIERLLREETPLGPRRMAVFLVLGPLFQGAAVAGMLRFPAPLFLATFAALDALLLATTLVAGRRLLARHLR